MKWVIKAKSSVQLLSLGKILPSGAETDFEGKELPKELLNAQRQGLILVEEVKEKKVEVKTPPKPWVKKEEATVMAAPPDNEINPPEEKPKKDKKPKKVKVEEELNEEEN
jgi:hypothetical protein